MNWRTDIKAMFINLPSRKDRRVNMEREFRRVGFEAERFVGLLPEECTNDTLQYAVMNSRTRGAIGCHYSQVGVMKEALKEDKHAMVLEDDLVFCSDFTKRLDYICNYLDGKQWDVFWLGGTYHRDAVWHKANHPNGLPCDCTLNRDWEHTQDARIVRTYGAFSTHAYIVNKDSIPKILALLEANVYRSIGIDYLFILLQPKLLTFAFVPGCVKQYDNASNIGDGVTKFSVFSRLGSHWFSDKM